MQLITAIIRPFKVDEVKDAITEAGCHGMTISEVKGFGRQGGHTETYRGAEYKVDLVPKIKIEVVVDDAQAVSITEAITEAAKTGKIGDGKIWTSPIESVTRIRTGEVNSEAI